LLIVGRVGTKTIQNCFAHCGSKHSDLEMPSKVDSENGVILEMHHVGNYKQFSFINSSVQCYNKNEDCEEAIVEQIVIKRQKIRKLMRMTQLSMNE
jgi:hypothetical protein